MSNATVTKKQSVLSDLSKEAADAQQAGNKSMFDKKSMNAWQDFSKDKISPDQLLNELIYEFETTFLIADTGVGKSILGVQFGEHVSGGKRMDGFRPLDQSRCTLLIDLEMSAKQNEKRYSERKDESTGKYFNHYRFSNNFFRVQIDSEKCIPDEYKTFEQWLFYSIEQLVIDGNVKVLIIDNITWLSTEQEKAKDAALLMKGLKAIRDKYHLTLLILAHTPKRDSAKPLILNDLAGSKMLANFIDAAFAIGKSSTGTNIRYVKQLKNRNDDIIYHSENIMAFEIIKPTNFLHFNFLGFGNETEHLKVYNANDKEQLKQDVLRLHNSGMSYGQIAKELNTNKTTVARIVNTELVF